MALSVVYPPRGSTSLSAVDIVAVHGLGGDAIDSWTHPTSNAFWLRDFLPQQIPDARILTFSYNSAAAFGTSTSEVIDYAKSLLSSLIDKRDEDEEQSRPLIFIAHSLGGIIVKQALLQARLESRFQPIKDATLGIMFFGTPHRGSEKAAYGNILATVANAVTRKPTPRLLTALQTNSDVLLRLTSDFRFQLPQYHVISFFEQQPMKNSSNLTNRMLLVEKYSALLETEHEEQIPVDANHSMINKFENDESDTFEKVYKRIRRMRNNPRVAVKDQANTTESYNKFFEVPRLLSGVFTGQNDVCQQLDRSLILAREREQAHVHAQIPRHPVQKRFVLYGLGGSGKTQIGVRYAQLHRQRYWGVFWVDASSVDTIQRSITQIALLLQVDQDTISVKRALANASEPWLLIFDNADDPRLRLTPYFPTGDRGHIIITSRSPNSCQYGTVGCYKLAQMSPSDAETLLLTIVHGNADVKEETKQGCQKVLRKLGYLALAITQAGAYICQMSCTYDEYFELYQQRQKEMMAYLPQHSTTDYHYSVYTTWQVSLDVIESMDDETSTSALRMLRLLGFYHHDQIPLEMFCNAWDHPNFPTIDGRWAPWPPTTQDLTDLKSSVQATVSLLASFSLVSRELSTSISIHPLVHEWCRLRSAAAEHKSAGRHATTLLAHSIKWDFETEDYTFRQSLLPHVHTCLRFCNLEQQEPTETTAFEYEGMSLVLSENGSIWEALKLQEQAVELKKGNLGEEHPDTLTSMHNLAIRYSEVGRQEEALRLIEQVVELRKSKLGEEHPDTLTSIHNLAIRYSEAGRQEEALRLTEQVVELHKSKLGEEHPDTLASMHNLAIRYSEAGRQEEALRLSEQVVELYKSKLGEEHPDTLRSMHNLAVYYNNVGRQDDAVRLMESVIQLREIKLGEQHPKTLDSKNALAYYLEESKKDDLPLSEAQSSPQSRERMPPQIRE